ncbi:asparagine--tRNA ligase, chloroplastic/mitochondrial isoform X3 [Manihot esculenta]|uniref:asparagine--tRNA ligase, chloroplastic/mitochondrial isoform X3 n=1 Tax=Manihot esculenta TaxID=3983 RepID=UPI001CC79686|nr:asparagine--tRNA ligase, chloroplastic/mitochondrial isoform X3 [Manihot esculenta]
MAVAALAPATPFRLRRCSTLRFFSSYTKSNPTIRPKIPQTLLKPHALPPKFPLPPHSSQHNPRSFCTVISGALRSGEKTKLESVEDLRGEMGDRVGPFRKKLKIVDIKGGPDEGLDRVGQTLVVMGWVRTLRAQSSVTFMEVNDGSCLSNMQCVMGMEAEGYDQVESGLVATGASIWVQGTVVKSQGSKQKVELKVNKIIMVGKSDPSYPIQKKRVSREFLRTKAHLRPRTNTFGAVARVRNALAYATHKFFQENGFVWVSSPIITASDCEGAGEQFCVTTLIPGSQEAVDSLVDGIPKTKEGLIDWSQDFFGKPAFLTVSGQLNAETYATALSDVYTFGPTFRAENSNTSRHLAEFWMIEPELAFADLNDDMACATAYLQYVVRHILENCKEDMDFFNNWIEKGIIDRLSVKWGCDLQSEHERYITEEAFGGCPVIIRDYPKEIKAFYMRQNDDGKTVAAMDMLVPRVGELIGGSQREERLEYLEDRLDNLKLNKDSYWWYLDLRRYGSVPHAGFGLGFERLVQFATGIENIRDAIPFPRAPGSAEF